MNHRLIVFLAIFSLCSCKDSKILSFLDPEEDVDFPTQRQSPTDVYLDNDIPIFYDLSDKTCDAKLSLKDMKAITLSMMGKDQTTPIAVSIPQTQGMGLTNAYILSMDYGYHIREDFHDCQKKTENTFVCQRSIIKAISQGKPLALCKNGGYPAESLESVALNALAGISLEASEIHKASPESISRMPKVRVLLQPKIEVVVHYQGETFQSIKTDNAFYSVRSTEPYPYFMGLLPHSKNYTKKFPQQLYFNQLAVIAHEWGHHLFYHLGQPLFQAYNHVETKIPKEDNPFARILLADKDKSSQGPNRLVSHSLVISSLNEMFADYFAYFTLENAQTTGRLFIGSFSPTRDLGNHLHSTHEEKSLTFAVLKHFFRSYYSYPDKFSAPNHQDVHVVGAVMGYGMSEYFSHFLEPNPTPGQMISLGVKWLERIAKLNQSGKNYEQSIYLLEDILELGTQIPNKTSKKGCAILEKRFPVFYPLWRIKKALNC